MVGFLLYVSRGHYKLVEKVKFSNCGPGYDCATKAQEGQEDASTQTHIRMCQRVAESQLTRFAAKDQWPPPAGLSRVRAM